MEREITVYFQTDMERIDRIREYFGMPRYLTVNCESPCKIDDEGEKWEMLKETERRGFIQIRDKVLDVPDIFLDNSNN